MKHYTTPVLEVTLDIPVETVQSIKFLFEQERDSEAEALLMKHYPGEVKYENGVYKVPITQEETALFAAEKYFYMDTLIVDQTGKVPETPIVSLFMSRSLFSHEEAVG